MTGIYLELARLADEDRARDCSADATAQRAAALLRATANRCCATLAVRVREAARVARSHLGRMRAAAACC